MFAAEVTIYDENDEVRARDIAYGTTVEGCDAAAGAMRRRMETEDGDNGIIGPTVEIKATTLMMAGCLQ